MHIEELWLFMSEQNENDEITFNSPDLDLLLSEFEELKEESLNFQRSINNSHDISEDELNIRFNL